MNELGLSAFVMGTRIGFDPDILIDKMKTLIHRAGTNFLILDGHHCLEKTTIVETINSDDAAIGGRCPAPVPLLAGQTASLPVLRAKGAFVVSANMTGNR